MSRKLKAQPTSISSRRPQVSGNGGAEIQPYGSVTERPIGLSANVREELARALNRILADTMTIRDLYKKAHWQVAGPTFYQLHLLFDEHYEKQSKLVDKIAERIQTLGGVSIAMAHDVIETTRIPRAPRGCEEPSAQIARLLEAHEILIEETRRCAHQAEESDDLGTNDLLVSNVLRKNEMQVWFLAQHLVELPLAEDLEKSRR